MSITKTDRAVVFTSLFLISLLVIYSSINKLNMTTSDYNTLFTVVATLGSGIIASIATVLLSNRKEIREEKTRIENTRRSFINILSSIYLEGIEHILEDCDNHIENFETYKENSYFINDCSFLNSSFFDIIDKNTLTKVFIEKNIDVSDLASLILIINVCKDNTPENIINKYISLANEQIDETKKDIDYLMRHGFSDDHKKEEFKNLEIKNQHNLTLYSQTTLYSLKHTKNQFIHLKIKINILIDSLK